MAASTLSLRCMKNQAVVVLRRVQTSAVQKSDVKTPIQKFGWEYLVRQEASGRPLSPHLTIYKPQLTWMLSGFHRISGCVMAGTLLFGGVGFAVLPINFTDFIEFARGLNLPSVITGAVKFVIAFPIIFHTLNGIRFLSFDLAKGTDIKSVYRSGWFVFGLAFVLAFAVVAKATCNKNAVKK